MNFKLILSIFALSFFGVSASVDYKFDLLTTADGLAHGCVQQIIQDDDGFMWIATEGGLNRYDGYEFKFYPLKNSAVFAIYEDPSDSGKAFWLGTQKAGLVHFDKISGNHTYFNHDPLNINSISSNDVKCVFKDSQGMFWIGTADAGLNRFDPKTNTFTRFQHDPNDSSAIGTNYVFALCEDRNGQLLVGTMGRGLLVFDRGKQLFRLVEKAPRHFSVPNIYRLFKDHSGVVWVGAMNGLYVLDDKTQTLREWQTPQQQALFRRAHIFSISEDHEKRLWITAQTNGIFGINRNRTAYIVFTHDPQNENSLISDEPSCAFRDRSGVIWAGNFCRGINVIRKQNKKFRVIRNISTIPGRNETSWVFNLHADKKNRLWIGGRTGLFCMKDGRLKRFKFTDYKYDNLLTICPAESGELWLVCGRGLSRFNPDSEKHVNYNAKYQIYSPDLRATVEKQNLKSRIISQLFPGENKKQGDCTFSIDSTVSALMLSFGKGTINKLYTEAFLIAQAEGDTIWRMTAEKSKYPGGDMEYRVQVALMELLPGKYRLSWVNNKPYAVEENLSFGKMTAAHGWMTVFQIEPVEKTIFQKLIEQHANNTLYGGELQGLAIDRQNKIWCTLTKSEKLLHAFDRERREFVPQVLEVAGKRIRSAYSYYPDRDGETWFFVPGNGLVRMYPDGKLDYFDLREEMLKFGHEIELDVSETIVFQDRRKNIWIKTDQELLQFDKASEKMIYFNHKDFMAPRQVFAILEDRQGNLWMSANNGLLKFDPITKLLREYTLADGLPVIKYAHTCATKFPDGRLAFGGNMGLVIFHPDSLLHNTNQPPVVFTDLKIFNKSVIPGEHSPLKTSIMHAKEIVLKHAQMIFSIHFAALDYNSPLKNKYAFKLEGIDKDWVYTDAHQRSATYTTLPAGEYSFKLKGSNNDGVWNENAASIRIIVLPPWWLSGWAYGIYVLIAFFLFFAIRAYDKKRQYLKHELLLEHLHAEKLEEINRMKSRFFANISHEFRTPLTLILGPLKKLSVKEKNESDKRILNIIKRNADHLLRLINQLLDFSKLESRKMKLQASKGNIIPFLKGLTMSFQSLAEQKNIKLQFIYKTEPIELYFDREKAEKIFINLLSNAFKFTPEYGEISIGIEKRENKVIIKIKDTGCGIPAEKLKHIFDLFYQADDSITRNQEGSGIGLALTKELVELNQGTIEVSSIQNQGTEFSVALPVGREHLTEDQIFAENIVLSETPAKFTETTEPDDIEGIKVTNSEMIVLVVEDNSDMRSYICEILHPAYRVIEAFNGIEGVEYAKQIIPDLIISDLMMPQKDGYQLCREIKQDETTSHIPIILMTAKAEQKDKYAGLQLGADEYLVKPFDSEELKIRIKNLIENRRKLQTAFMGRNKNFSNEKLPGPMDQRFMERVLHVIENNLVDEQFGVLQMSGEIGMSATQLRRKMVALTGYSPNQFIRLQRLKEAARLIGEEQLSVSESAYRSGFNSLSYFSKCFKEEFGILPSEYKSHI